MLRNLLVVAAVFAAACSKQPTSAGETAGAGGEAPPAKGDASIPGATSDIDIVQAHYARELTVAPADIKVRIPTKVSIPGITLFNASVDPAKAGRPVTRNGIVEGGHVYVAQDAMARVARAWNYGDKRPVSAKDFATVMGILHSATHGSAAITDADTLDVFKSTAHPKRAAAAALPVETSVDGKPAVRYSLTSEGPLTIVTAIVHPDFRVELQAHPVRPD
ncbi:MAG: hypothetical protein KF901_33785 [Myxococcales bacterium]|nr:hypothetical protein [Myxococcales bacterium]